jgi:hypothetical protein
MTSNDTSKKAAREPEATEHMLKVKSPSTHVTPCHPCADLLVCSVHQKCNLVGISKFSPERVIRVQANAKGLPVYCYRWAERAANWQPNACEPLQSEEESFSHRYREGLQKPNVSNVTLSTRLKMCQSSVPGS